MHHYGYSISLCSGLNTSVFHQDLWICSHKAVRAEEELWGALEIQRVWRGCPFSERKTKSSSDALRTHSHGLEHFLLKVFGPCEVGKQIRRGADAMVAC